MINKVHILVIRLSAMGDVALTLPVIRGILDANPNVRITLLTRKFFSAFFAHIDRLDVYAPELNGKHKGFKGIFNLYKDLKAAHNFDLVIDLHSVIRSSILTSLFRYSKVQNHTLKKDRILKKSYLGKNIEPNLPHTIERYMAVFKSAGLQGNPKAPPLFNISEQENNAVRDFISQNGLSNKKLIGLAPFAKHNLKVWPHKKIVNLLKRLHSHPEIHVVLFGGGKEEMEKLELLANISENCIVPKLNFPTEIALMGKLSLMISMDSSNMHIAALSGIPVVSIWGATHPGIGFGAWMQPEENTVQIPKSELGCRPCTIYGKGICARKDFACMVRIASKDVYFKVVGMLGMEPLHEK